MLACLAFGRQPDRHAIDYKQLAQSELCSQDDATLNSDWKLGSYFPNIKVLTMDPDDERFQRCKQEFDLIGLKPQEYEVVRGVDGKTLPEALWERMESFDLRNGPCPDEWVDRRKQGRMGCYMAQFKIIRDAALSFEKARMALEDVLASNASEEALDVARANVRKFSSVLLIEDNNGFGKITGPRTAEIGNYGELFRRVMQDLPSDWNMLYFKSMEDSQNPVRQITPYLAQLTYGFVTKCYAINANFYGRVITALEQRINDPDQTLEPVDNVIASLHETSKCFVTTPPLTYRVASKSLVYGGGEINPPQEDWANWQSDAAKKNSPIEVQAFEDSLR